ncbi:putative mitotic check point protein [Podospora australis]|uniref:Mitotic check point protein n=1 Tax=Podospora australis TaxID=1536484 RepID=A0AAN6X2L6_9PEZI|nr:putative mitotic check point protein [Podospora australis]
MTLLDLKAKPHSQLERNERSTTTRMPSPTKTQETLSPHPASLHQARQATMLGQVHPPPPPPGTHRTLRRLQSAHSLGAKATAAAGGQQTASLISQQRYQLQNAPHLQHLHLQAPQQLPPPVPSLPNPNYHQLQQRPKLPPAPPPSNPPSIPPRRHVNINRSPQRARANSDALILPIPTQQQFGAMASTRRSALSKRSLAADAMSLERLVRDGPPNGDVEGALESVRLKILDQGIKADSDGMSSLRVYVWLILLNAPVLSTPDYLELVHRGASPAYAKIRNDTFRTLTTDPLFRRRVSEASLIRLLNAIAWKLHDAREERNNNTREPSICSSSRLSLDHSGSRPGTGYSNAGFDGFDSNPTSPSAKNRARALTLTTEGSEASMALEPGTYVQGMNVLAAPFLYAARSEAEAFIAFYQLLTKELPGYIRGAMAGVHKGLALVDKVLAIVDPKLSLYLMSKNLSAKIYAFPSVLTLCACTPPLPEVLRLWDFLFAYGPHLNILCIVAQLVMIRTKIMESPSPNKLLRSFPALQADQIKRTTLAIIKMIPDDVYAEIVTHAR